MPAPIARARSLPRRKSIACASGKLSIRNQFDSARANDDECGPRTDAIRDAKALTARVLAIEAASRNQESVAGFPSAARAGFSSAKREAGRVQLCDDFTADVAGRAVNADHHTEDWTYMTPDTEGTEAPDQHGAT